jgi:hypothetical protein
MNSTLGEGGPVDLVRATDSPSLLLLHCGLDFLNALGRAFPSKTGCLSIAPPCLPPAATWQENKGENWQQGGSSPRIVLAWLEPLRAHTALEGGGGSRHIEIQNCTTCNWNRNCTLLAFAHVANPPTQYCRWEGAVRGLFVTVCLFFLYLFSLYLQCAFVSVQSGCFCFYLLSSFILFPRLFCFSFSTLHSVLILNFNLF